MSEIGWGTHGISKEIPYPDNIVDYIRKNTPEDTENEVTPKSVLRGMHNTFSTREMAAIEMRFRDWKRLREIGEYLGVTRERARSFLNQIVQDMLQDSTIKACTVVPYERYKREVERADELDRQTREMRGLLIEAGRFPAGLQTPLSNTGLSKRSMHCLQSMKYYTVGDLLSIQTEDELMGISNLGVKTAKDIIDKMHSYGYKMKWEGNDVGIE